MNFLLLTVQTYIADISPSYYAYESASPVTYTKNRMSIILNESI